MESSFSGWLDSRHLVTRRIFLPVLSAQTQVNNQGTAESSRPARKTELSINSVGRGPILPGCRGGCVSCWEAKAQKGSGSYGVLAVPVVSQACRAQGLHWLLALKVHISDTAHGILAPSLLSSLAKVFTCISSHTRLAGALLPAFPP